jgi:hypothetical protein
MTHIKTVDHAQRKTSHQNEGKPSMLWSPWVVKPRRTSDPIGAADRHHGDVIRMT